MAKKITLEIGPPQWLKNGRWFWIFGGAFLMLGIFLPWFDIGIESVNGFKLITAFGQQPDVVQNGMHSMTTAALPFAASILFLAVGILGFARPKLLQEYPRIIWWALVLSGTLAALVSGLPAHTQKLAGSVSFGHWITVLSAVAVVVATLIDAALHDPQNKQEDRSKILFPATFLAILAAALLVNYAFVNYTLIPKATEIIQRLAS